MISRYLFQSERLGFRTWKESDLTAFAAMNSDPKEMQHFPAILTTSESKSLIEKQYSTFSKKSYCYFAADELSSGKLIGMIGISDKFFKSTFTPAVDIGWRLAQDFWGKGYATEGAQRCLLYAFEQLQLKRIISIATKSNVNSIRVMENIGMYKLVDFKHPLLTDYKNLVHCVCYEIQSTSR